MVEILIYYPYFDGTSTSLIDTYYNLKKYGLEVECYIAIDTKEIKRNIEYMQALRKSVPADFRYKVISLEDIYKKEYNNLIMSFGVFRFLDQLPDKYNHLYLLDAGRIAYDYFLGESKYIQYVKNMKNVRVYGNKANQKFFGEYEGYRVWYHKFSRERFNHLKGLEVKIQIMTEDKREKTGNIGFNYILSNELHYNRYKRWDSNKKGMCFENIGKMIFEFSALGKKVLYSPLNKDYSDGLEEYLGLFGIDDTVEQEIHISEEELFSVLGMKGNDVLLNDIRRGENDRFSEIKI